MTADYLFIFIITMVAGSFIPGPSMLLALTHGMKYGVKKTLFSALGNIVVTFFQALISIAGLGAILIASGTVFTVIKIAGALYLVYIGVTLIKNPKLKSDDSVKAEQSEEKNSLQMFYQAATVTAGNPKAIVFFTAIFPQVINPATAGIYQLAILLLIALIIGFGTFMLYALSGSRLVALFSAEKSGKYVMWIMGTTFIGVGIALAVSGL